MPRPSTPEAEPAARIALWRHTPDAYQGIADTIERDIASGRFVPGGRLPTHRAMAKRLGVAVATVSRAYAEVRRRGLTDARAGSGTFVRPAPGGGVGEVPEACDLTVSSLDPLRHATEIFQRMAWVAPRDQALLGYPPTAGLPAHRETGAQWLRGVGLDCPADRVLLTVGAQHGLAVAFAALLTPGEVVLAESLTYHGVRAQAGVLGFRLQAVAMDHEGLDPDALAAVARASGARVVYCIPTLQNPTSAVMSASRREALAVVARACDLTIVEDDVYGPLVPDLPRLASLAPERTIYVASAAKSLAAALRIGFLAAPAPLVARLEQVLAATTLGASPLVAETVHRLIADGVAGRIVAWKRDELAARQDVVTRLFAGLELRAHPASQNVWLSLPEGWTADRFVARAQLEGVLVSPASSFAVEAPGPEAVRFSVGPPETRAHLERALTTLRSLLRNERATRPVI